VQSQRFPASTWTPETAAEMEFGLDPTNTVACVFEQQRWKGSGRYGAPKIAHAPGTLPGNGRGPDGKIVESL